MEPHLASPATWDHTPNTGKRAPTKPQPDRPAFDLPTPEG